MARRGLLAQALAIGKYVLGAFYVQQGSLTHWRMREGLKLLEPEKVGALMFQRTLIHRKDARRVRGPDALCHVKL